CLKILRSESLAPRQDCSWCGTHHALCEAQSVPDQADMPLAWEGCASIPARDAILECAMGLASCELHA
ncbi:hypothetical protein L195_g060964, partial [Trifolium pratense]